MMDAKNLHLRGCKAVNIDKTKDTVKPFTLTQIIFMALNNY